jgi:hypothetical protein
LNQLENTGPPPASEDQLKNLPVVTISEEDVGKFQTSKKSISIQK